MKCRNCGLKIAATDKFCGNCGSALQPSPQPAMTSKHQKTGCSRNTWLFLAIGCGGLVLLIIILGSAVFLISPERRYFLDPVLREIGSWERGVEPALQPGLSPTDDFSISGSEGFQTSPTAQFDDEVNEGFEELMIFESDQYGHFDIYSLEITSGLVQRLTADPGADMLPVCSPGGAWIAFSSNRTGEQQIFIISRDGQTLRMITDSGPGIKYPLGWVSETEIIYTTGDEYEETFFRVDINVGKSVELSQTDEDSFSFLTMKRLSPDGTAELDVDQQKDYSLDIIIIDQNGEKNLTNSLGVDDWSPQWSPDGQQILYQSDMDGDSEIYLMDRNGNVLEQLTENSWDDYIGCWLP